MIRGMEFLSIPFSRRVRRESDSGPEFQRDDLGERLRRSALR